MSTAAENRQALPGPLPEGEHILWQGAPELRSLAIRAFWARAAALYFGALILARAALGAAIGEEAGAVIAAAAWLGWCAVAAVGILALLAWAVQRSTIYTITNKRVVLRIGAAIPKHINLPFALIEAAALRSYPGGAGDLALSLGGDARIGYVHLWPHARPWRFSKPEPMLRCVPNAAAVAQTLAGALEGRRQAPPEPMNIAKRATQPRAVDGRLAAA